MSFPIKMYTLKETCKNDYKTCMESDREEADYIRQTDEWKIVYPQRKETIERVFADAKENHGMRFTRLKGLVKNQHESLIIFSCHNLKKLGLCKRRMGLI